MTKTLSSEKLPPLFKASGGKTVVWQIWIEADGQEADIVVQYGYIDGAQQTQRERIKTGKNAGKINETTAIQQAYAEAKSRWTKQLTRKGYGETVEVSKATRAISPMLAYRYQDYRTKIDWANAFAQRKLDGSRCLASYVDGEVRLRSREGKPINTVPHVNEALISFFENSPDAILDGELYSHGMGAINTQLSAMKKKSANSEKLIYNVYDQISPQPFARRFGEIEKGLHRLDSQAVLLVETIAVDNDSELAVAHQRFVDAGFEGSMLRHGIAAYEAGKRSKWLLKNKDWLSSEFKITDVKEGRGTHAGLAIFVCVTPAGNMFEVLSPGTHDEKRDFFARRDRLIGKEVEVKYREYSDTEEPVPLYPVGLRVVEE